MLSEELATMTALLRRSANDYGGRLYLSRRTTDILLSNLQFLAEDIARYEQPETGMDVDTSAIMAIIRELIAAKASLGEGALPVTPGECPSMALQRD